MSEARDNRGATREAEKVVSLADYQHHEPDGDGLDEFGKCACGNVWFILRGRRNDPPIAASGAVTMTTAGTISGYIGEPHCSDCGEPWAPRGGWKWH